MKKILILTASFGEGHNSAGRGIRDALIQLAPDAQVEFRDLFAQTFGPANEAVRRAYLAMINRLPRAWAGIYAWLDRQQPSDFTRNFQVFRLVRNKLSATLARMRPDVVVCVYPAYGYLLQEILGRQPRPDCKRVICVTDSISVNAIWYRSTADFYLVPNEESAEVMRVAGVPSEIIRTFGFPVSPRFAELATTARRPETVTPRVLYIINAGKSVAPALVRKLVDLNIDLTVTVGRDDTLRRAVHAAAAGAPRGLESVRWTEEMPRLLFDNELVISKAGGATVQESFAAGCPMIVNRIVPGQEEGNARLILQSDCGAVALTHDAVVREVERAFANNRQQWRRWRDNVARISKPRAALETAEFLLSL